MGMALIYELNACYAAGTLFGTLGRLNAALKRLSRLSHLNNFEKIGESFNYRVVSETEIGILNQNARIMSDQWHLESYRSAEHLKIDAAIARLKANSLNKINLVRRWPLDCYSWLDYQSLAQLMDSLRLGQYLLL